MRRALLAVLGLSVVLSTPATFAADAPAPDKPADGEKSRDETRGYIGISWQLAQRLNDEERKELGITLEKGLFIAFVLPSGPADKAGVKRGDRPVSINGTALPSGEDVAKDDESFRAFMEGKLKPIGEKTNPGDTVELVVTRDGKSMTFHCVAVDKKTSDLLSDEANRESWSVKVPPPEGRGAPAASKLDFQTVPEGESRPADFLQVTGYWEVAAEDGKPDNKVVVQSTDEGDSFCLGLSVADGRVYKDGKASVRFQLKGGERSVSAGIAVRCRDRRNYYAVRLDGVAQNLAIVKVADSIPTVLAKTEAKSPKLGTWHTMEVVFAGGTLQATLDGSVKVEAKDTTFAEGWAGIVTWGDASSAFDDLAVTPGGPGK